MADPTTPTPATEPTTEIDMTQIARDANNAAIQAKADAAAAKKLQRTGIVLGALALLAFLVVAIWLGTRDKGVSQEDHNSLKAEVATNKSELTKKVDDVKAEVATKADAQAMADALNGKANTATVTLLGDDVAKIKGDMYDDKGKLKLATAADLAKVKKTADLARRMSKTNQENLATVELATNTAIAALKADADALKAEVAALKAAPSKVSGGPVKVRINQPDGQVKEYDLR